MNVRVQPCDRGGCGWYRTRWPSAALQAHGLPVTVADHWPDARFVKQANGTTRLVDVPDLDDVDVWVVQRPLDGAVVESIPRVRRQGVAVVVEIDDDFHSLPKGHPARRGTSVAGNERHNRRWLRKACEQADLVVCTTEAIAARYGAHGRVAVIPNFVPAWYLTVDEPRLDDRVRVGWTGSTHTHVGDLEVMGDGLARALADSGAVFRVVGTGVGVADQCGVEPDETTGWVEIVDYPVEYARLDVAVVPLEACAFNEAKSSLKMSEAAALGVPVVASPTGPNVELHDLGVGRLAASPVEWRYHVSELARSSEARAHVAGEGRAVMRDRTIEGNAWRWWEAWETAMANRRHAGRVAA